ncbi:S-adenosyl-L-methionine-dependent methyltransferase [Microdochium bolleyi]|uniref:S-adenosyl-L-methionine-dependent methyltransferase n=1 Tax=Microdochium bolleyi TaxID=196109 RepID=A0A136JJE9_9PEZI|nr:S-adenosyl-L-methionine-dependent methyltransferase [Microdochium bolleyi]
MDDAADPTFRHYKPEDGLTYAQHRQDYHPKLYQLVLDHHRATGGAFDTLLDVGCGPGTAGRALAPNFAHAWGVDPSAGMIAAARQLGGTAGGASSTGTGGEPIRFEICPAEDLITGTGIADASVDLLISAAAAHWFDMPRFWAAASRVLKPGGTVALWCGGSMRPDPGCPGAEAMQAAADEFDAEVDAFLAHGNRLCVGMYRDLGLPWEVDAGGADQARALRGFDEASFRRVEWGTAAPGSLPMSELHASKSRSGGGGGGGAQEGEMPMDALEMVLGTASYVTRWREANAELIAGHPERDVVRKFRARLEAALAAAGAPTDRVRGGVTGFMLLVKRKEE